MMTDKRLLIKHSTLEGIAGAVRTKKGTTELIPVPDLESEILSIHTDIKLQEKTVTENKVVTADEGFDGLSKVIVNVEGGTDISELTATASQVLSGQVFYGLSGRDTGSMEDNGYTNGDSVIELDTTLPSVELNGAYRGTASIKFDEKRTITENGPYKVLGDIEVAVPNAEVSKGNLTILDGHEKAYEIVYPCCLSDGSIVTRMETLYGDGEGDVTFNDIPLGTPIVIYSSVGDALDNGDFEGIEEITFTSNLPCRIYKLTSKYARASFL